MPVKNGFKEFADVGGESTTAGHQNVTGHCIEVFDAVMSKMPYPVTYEYVPFPNSSESYDNLVSLLPDQSADIVVGDVIITASSRAGWARWKLACRSQTRGGR
ncbi:unnamed protein product [Miscanthus lutarioriparius]|uniref:Uncharacterized protein n=1 Tax=Miscanthus lutarioriparius TaxID=422564 RepID=A0A811SJ20_9POAL|nr:unnamed protein product [Miscanthus lutarioriparius]